MVGGKWSVMAIRRDVASGTSYLVFSEGSSWIAAYDSERRSDGREANISSAKNYGYYQQLAIGGNGASYFDEVTQLTGIVSIVVVRLRLDNRLDLILPTFGDSSSRSLGRWC